MPRQMRFDLAVRPALGRGDFYVAPSNAVAVAMIDGWRDWAGGKLALCGPAGAGKTHLAHVWAAQAGARIVAARDLDGADVPMLASRPVVVEDVPEIAGRETAEAALFHLHNLVLAEGHRLLLTGREVPARWGLALPDLQSRVDGSAAATLGAPDDDLLAAVLTKLFADRQIVPGPELVPYLARRIDRSFAAAADIVARLDEVAMDEGRPLGRALAARLLGDPD